MRRGILAILLGFPHLARGTYFSENALLPGAGERTFGIDHARTALDLSLSLVAAVSRHGVIEILVNAARIAGLETSNHSFTSEAGQVHTSIVAVLRAARGDGKESIVLSAEYPAGRDERSGAAESAGLLLALQQVLARVPWLSRDFIFVLTPSGESLGRLHLPI